MRDLKIWKLHSSNSMINFSIFNLEFDPDVGAKIINSKSCAVQTAEQQHKKYSSVSTTHSSYDKFNSDPIILSELSDDLGECKEPNKLTTIILNNAFPESAKRLNPSQPHFFTFTVRDDQLRSTENTLYCYTVFMSIANPNLKRRFYQFSYVIVTKLNCPSIFRELLISSINSVQILDQATVCDFKAEIFEVLFSFLKQWKEIISGSLQSQLSFIEEVDSPKQNNQIGPQVVELPLIDQSLKIRVTRINFSKFKINRVIDGSPSYIFKSLNLFQIQQIDQMLQLTNAQNSIYNETLNLLWDCLVFNKKILIVGATPTEATDAVFAFSTLMKNVHCILIPYISVTDKSFMKLVNTNEPTYFPVIVGISNPIAEVLIDLERKHTEKTFFDYIYYVGFDDKVGFKQIMASKLDDKSQLIAFAHSQSTNRNLNNKGSSVSTTHSNDCLLMDVLLNKQLNKYTNTLVHAINEGLSKMAQTDYLSLLFGHINILQLQTALSKYIHISKISKSLFQNPQNKPFMQLYAENLINSQLFLNARKKMLYSSVISKDNLTNSAIVNAVVEQIRCLKITCSNKESSVSDSSDSGSMSDDDMQPKIENLRFKKNIIKIYVHALKSTNEEPMRKKLKKSLRFVVSSINPLN